MSKVVLITGASAGVGRAWARVFASEGAGGVAGMVLLGVRGRG